MPSSLIGEFFGTAILILLGNGVVAAVILNKSKAQNGGWIVITAGWGFAVMCGAFVAAALGSPSADLNPALTLANYLRGNIELGLALAFMVAQVLGAITGSVLMYLAYLPHWQETEGNKLGIFATQPAIYKPGQNLLTEIIATFVLVFVIYAIFSTGATNGAPAPGLGTYLVASLVWGLGLSLGGPTGYAINPARDLGPRIAHAILPIPGKQSSEWHYAWVPIVGPFIGAALAALLFMALVPSP